jgi:MinD-like ATPase involved in chromosome partitioning or flagellar assembly
MALMCFASQKGAPGVTVTALAVAAAWPTDGRRKVLVEADADGGSLAVRFQLGRQPGLVSLAAASRHGVAREELWAHAQMLPGGLPVIVAPERADRAGAVLSTSARSLALWLAALPDVDVIVDCGRLGPSSAAMPFAQCADYVFMVARPVAEQIQPATERAVVLLQERIQVAWVLIGDRPYAPAEVAAATGIPVAAVLPDDPRAAAALWAGSSKKARRSPLVRTASALALAIARSTRLEATPSLEDAIEPLLAEAN